MGSVEWSLLGILSRPLPLHLPSLSPSLKNKNRNNQPPASSSGFSQRSWDVGHCHRALEGWGQAWAASWTTSRPWEVPIPWPQSWPPFHLHSTSALWAQTLNLGRRLTVPSPTSHQVPGTWALLRFGICFPQFPKAYAPLCSKVPRLHSAPCPGELRLLPRPPGGGLKWPPPG